jgi:hypothetical protein
MFCTFELVVDDYCKIYRCRRLNMNTKQNNLIEQLKEVLQEIDMQCIDDEEFDNEIQSLNIFSRNINDIVEDMEHVD